jgi:hypothetical protein
MQEILRHHFQVALQTRQSDDLPVKVPIRIVWCTAKGDCLSGLAVDVIESTAVVMSSAAWCQVIAMSSQKHCWKSYLMAPLGFEDYGESASARRARS